MALKARVRQIRAEKSQYFQRPFFAAPNFPKLFLAVLRDLNGLGREKFGNCSRCLTEMALGWLADCLTGESAADSSLRWTARRLIRLIERA
jgi:hypothetical protein